MLKHVVLEKPIGHTPLQAITEWKSRNQEYRDIPATYAGRLDPMASGKLLILLGNECKRLKEYTRLDKQYQIEIVFGIRTDTGDALGVPAAVLPARPTRQDVERACRAVIGSHTIPYHPFSSKTVKGVPLFHYSLEGRLDEIDIPTHVETIYRIQLDEYQEISREHLLARLHTHLEYAPRTDDPAKRRGADFRQDEIRIAWKRELEGRTDAVFPIALLTVTCASGTYMRTLAERLGKELGTSGFALTIHRTRIGRYLRLGPAGVWTKQY